MSAPTRLLRRAALAGLLVLVLAPSALAATPTKKVPAGPTGKNCWSALIKDWYDGRIDDTYPVHCYKDALKNLPPDVKTYSDAYDVISRALAAATHDKKTVDPDALIQPPDATGGTKTSTNENGTTTTTAVGPTDGGNDGGNAAPPLTHLPGDRGADGVPVPLLILGGLALLLVAAGGAGLVARRLQGRRGGPGTA